jgi:hypothetical protein
VVLRLRDRLRRTAPAVRRASRASRAQTRPLGRGRGRWRVASADPDALAVSRGRSNHAGTPAPPERYDSLAGGASSSPSSATRTTVCSRPGDSPQSPHRRARGGGIRCTGEQRPTSFAPACVRELASHARVAPLAARSRRGDVVDSNRVLLDGVRGRLSRGAASPPGGGGGFWIDERPVTVAEFRRFVCVAAEPLHVGVDSEPFVAAPAASPCYGPDPAATSRDASSRAVRHLWAPN